MKCSGVIHGSFQSIDVKGRLGKPRSFIWITFQWEDIKPSECHIKKKKSKAIMTRMKYFRDGKVFNDRVLFRDL
jgi:hypothetical protein